MSLKLLEKAAKAHFWYRLISRRATVPGLYLCGFLTPPETCCWGADFRAALVATVGRTERYAVIVYVGWGAGMKGGGTGQKGDELE